MNAAPKSPLQFPADTPFSGAEIKTWYQRRMDVNLVRTETHTTCPIHNGERDSFSINSDTGLWKCHSECGIGGDIFDLEKLLTNAPFPRAKAAVYAILGRPDRQPREGAPVNGSESKQQPKLKLGPIVEEYIYEDETGAPRMRVTRHFPPKDFRQQRPDGKGGWIWNLDGIEPVLYRLPKVLAASTLLLCEGEKDVHTAEHFGLVATTVPMGAGKWQPQYTAVLAGKTVTIFPDNDKAGIEHRDKVVRELAGHATVSVAIVPDPHKDLTDWVSAGATREEIVRAIKDANLQKQSPLQQSETHTALRPRIKTGNRQLHEVSLEALAALQKSNNPPELFSRSGIMTAVVKNERGQYVIAAVDDDALRGRLSRSADYYRLVPGKERVEIGITPPLDVVKDIASQSPSNWDFPTLDAITEAPTLRPDGTILDRPGYDAATRLYYAPASDLQVPPIPHRPTGDQIARAVTTIEDVIGQFPFVDAASRANMFAALLTPQIKPAINGAPTPLGLIDATSPGTGKTLLAELVALIATSRNGDLVSAPRDVDEWRKQISSLVLMGSTVAVFDNLVHRLDSPELCKALTAEMHVDRMIKTYDLIQLPIRCFFMATGNNIALGGDMPRRCFHIRMDAGMVNPFLRSDFRHANLKQYVRDNRGNILGALLTLARSWYANGKPKPTVKSVGSFEDWTITVGGILENAGISGFLANSQELYDRGDIEGEQWAIFLNVLSDHFDDEFKVSAVWQSVQDSRRDGGSGAIKESLPDSILEVAEKEGVFLRRLGREFAARVGRRYGSKEFHVTRARVDHKVQQWRILSSERVTRGV